VEKLTRGKTTAAHAVAPTAHATNAAKRVRWESFPCHSEKKLPANRIADPRHLALGGSQEIKPACITGSSDDFDFLLMIRRIGTTTPLRHDPNTTVPRLSIGFNHRKMDDKPREAG